MKISQTHEAENFISVAIQQPCSPSSVATTIRRVDWFPSSIRASAQDGRLEGPAALRGRGDFVAVLGFVANQLLDLA